MIEEGSCGALCAQGVQPGGWRSGVGLREGSFMTTGSGGIALVRTILSANQYTATFECFSSRSGVAELWDRLWEKLGGKR